MSGQAFELRLCADKVGQVMTTEILRSMLFRGADIVRDIEFVIFDEVLQYSVVVDNVMVLAIQCGGGHTVWGWTM